jgi:hypothetical protein
VTGVSLSLSVATIAIVLILLLSVYLKRLGSAESDLRNEREKNEFLEKFNRAISRPILSGRDLISGLRDWTKK